jgi:acyl-CoA reductase-like NAD-dependent aldehyde dehydrogenase
VTTTIEVAPAPTPNFLSGTVAKPMFIDGRWTPSASGATFQTVNPATGTVLAEVAAGDQADVDRAVIAARRAFENPIWSAMNPHERTLVLLRIADSLEANIDELAELETLDAGIPITLTRGMVADAARTFRYYAGWPTKLTGLVNPVDPSVHCYTVREPIGVCAGIVPWNGPITMAAWKIAPALACGNSIIIKPAEQTSLSTLRMAEILHATGLPDGVLNVVTGLGPTAGAAIAAHPDIDKVSFTGSTATGKSILQASIGNLKRVTLELGGKSPHIIMADADLPAAARSAAAGFAMLTGQVCVAGTRILVHESVQDEFAEHLATALAAFRVGDPFADDTLLGPVVSAQQFERVNSYLAIGRDEGAHVAIGGESLDGDGYFIQPTVFAGVNNDMRLAREEIFGPVAALLSFRDVDEAVRIANDTTYGLAAAVATTNVSTAHSIARRLRAGVVWINTYSELDTTFPFGGFKQSGIGRELGEKSLDNFTELKSVFVRL